MKTPLSPYPADWQQVLNIFEPEFTAPQFGNFCQVATCMATSNSTSVCRWSQAYCPKHQSTLNDFFTQSPWDDAGVRTRLHCLIGRRVRDRRAGVFDDTFAHKPYAEKMDHLGWFHDGLSELPRAKAARGRGGGSPALVEYRCLPRRTLLHPMLALPFLDVAFHRLRVHRSDGAVEISPAPEFLAPKFIVEHPRIAAAHHIRAVAFELARQLCDGKSLPSDDKRMQMVRAALDRRDVDAQLLRFLDDIGRRQFADHRVREDVTPVRRRELQVQVRLADGVRTAHKLVCHGRSPMVFLGRKLPLLRVLFRLGGPLP